eukprot:2870629-Prymnesium_polylepis.1
MWRAEEVLHGRRCVGDCPGMVLASRASAPQPQRVPQRRRAGERDVAAAHAFVAVRCRARRLEARLDLP